VLLLFEKKYRRCDPRARERINNLLEFATVCLILLFVRRYYYSPEKIQAPPFWLLPEEGTRESKFFFPRFQHTHTPERGETIPTTNHSQQQRRTLCFLFLLSLPPRDRSATRGADAKRAIRRKENAFERERERERTSQKLDLCISCKKRAELTFKESLSWRFKRYEAFSGRNRDRDARERI